LARLDGATSTLPNPDLFVYAFMRQEAVLSSQIEGTQASLEDILEYEASTDTVQQTDDLREVINYLAAMDYGLEKLPKLPVSCRLIKEMHQILLRNGRGADRAPGEFRQNQNWIGPPGCTIEDASYVPPAVPLMIAAMSDWERFVNEERDLPPLIKCAVAHAQFETIHPFWDGNGRLGRMIVTLMLCSESILARPILYLSLFFKQHREEYYGLLQGTRDMGDWESWVLFFLRGVTATSRAALETASKIMQLRERLIAQSYEISRSKKAGEFGERLFKHPYLGITNAARLLDVTYPTAKTLVTDFEKAGYLVKAGTVERPWGKIYAFKPYLDILHEGAGDLTGVLAGTDYLATNYERTG
jgi:Fic family protein